MLSNIDFTTIIIIIVYNGRKKEGDELINEVKWKYRAIALHMSSIVHGYLLSGALNVLL